ncbi:MAG: hypothetical protein JOS17DRAFT_835515 [Linnemannia elongata]|nr:MAG: hypothetical protein JOS17DRAFT_835515 [Linnemannia elongata]
MSHHPPHSGIPVGNYGVWACTPIGYRSETREIDRVSPHIHLFFIDDTSATSHKYFTAAINVKSKGAEARLVFWHLENFQHPIISDLKSLQHHRGFYPLPSNMFSTLKGLDYIRMKDLIPNFPVHGILLEQDIPGRDNDMLDKMRPILNRAIEDRATVYLFGSQFNPSGIHDVHMNQGSLPQFPNGVYQDGAIIFQFEDHWEAVFLAFGSQKVPTDDERGLASLALLLGKMPLTPERD